MLSCLALAHASLSDLSGAHAIVTKRTLPDMLSDLSTCQTEISVLRASNISLQSELNHAKALIREMEYEREKSVRREKD